jgi:GNAT superfamily N-acetyltransferase
VTGGLAIVSKINVAIACSRPSDVDAANERAFKTLVLDAGEVNPATLSDLYQRAKILAFARHEGELAAVGAIKRPYAEHRAGVFGRAVSKLEPASFEYELGWFYVLPKFWGNRISSQLVRALMPYADGASVFATSHVENDRMHAAMTKHGGFVREGSPYPSLENHIPIQLYVRRWVRAGEPSVSGTQ